MARMALRADATKYYLGYIWWILEPLMWVGVFYLVFVVLLHNRKANFLMFLATGKLAFIWFSKTVTQAANSIVGGRGLVGKISVPMTLFPMAVVQEGIYRQVVVFALLFAFLMAGGYTVTTTWWHLVPILLVNYIMIVACAFAAACLVCVARDFNQIIQLGMMFLMFTSGIFWDLRTLSDPEATMLVMNLNPMAFILDAYRQVVMHNTPPDMIHLALIGLGFSVMTWFMVMVMRGSSQYLALRAITA
jgi:lipopolysaccharide transport system permease protein